MTQPILNRNYSISIWGLKNIYIFVYKDIFGLYAFKQLNKLVKAFFLFIFLFRYFLM